jgi:hypothetical protein
MGAVYRPDAEIVPPVADHVTDVLLDPVTVAVNCCVPLVVNEALAGLMLIATGTVTVIVADALFVASATLVAVTV